MLFVLGFGQSFVFVLRFGTNITDTPQCHRTGYRIFQKRIFGLGKNQANPCLDVRIRSQFLWYKNDAK